MAKKHTEENIFENAEIWNLGQIGKTEEEKKKKEEEDYDFLNLGFDPVPPSGTGRSGLKYSPAVKPKARKRKSVLPILLLLAVVIGGSFLLAGTPSPKPSVETPTVGVVYTEPVETVPVETVPEVPACEIRWYGSYLNEDQKAMYREFVNTIENFAESMEVTVDAAGVTSTDQAWEYFDEARAAAFLDYGELFWIENGGGRHASREDASSGRAVYKITYYPLYRLDRQTALEQKAYIEQATQDFLAAHQYDSEWEKTLAVYEYLIDNCRYDLTYTNYYTYEMLHDRTVVCNGYARTAQYLLRLLDVPVIFVSGMATNSAGQRELHAWNIVNIGGQWCNFDATWGDPASEDGPDLKSFAYFCMPDSIFLQNHEPDLAESLPQCTTSEYMYHTVMGYRFEYYDEQKLIRMIAAAEDGEKQIEFLTANAQVYQDIQNRLWQQGGIYNVYRSAVGREIVNPLMYEYPEQGIMVITWD